MLLILGFRFWKIQNLTTLFLSKMRISQELVPRKWLHGPKLPWNAFGVKKFLLASKFFIASRCWETSILPFYFFYAVVCWVVHCWHAINLSSSVCTISRCISTPAVLVWCWVQNFLALISDAASRDASGGFITRSAETESWTSCNKHKTRKRTVKHCTSRS